MYGTELILDLHGCDATKFTREHIGSFFVELCDRIGMQAEDLHFWDDLDTPEEEKETEPHLVGTSAIQFIKTSNITIHTLDLMEHVYLNIFSCKDFNSIAAADFCVAFFGGSVVQRKVVQRF